MEGHTDDDNDDHSRSVRRVDAGEVEELVMAESGQGRSKLGTHQHCTGNSMASTAPKVPRWLAAESVRVRQQRHATKRSLGPGPRQEAACIGQAVSDECCRCWAQRPWVRLTMHVHDDVCAKPRSSFKYNQWHEVGCKCLVGAVQVSRTQWAFANGSAPMCVAMGDSGCSP